MNVCITKAGKPTYWYASSIGRIFRVYDNPSALYTGGPLNYELDDGSLLFIGVDDCEIVSENEEETPNTGSSCVFCETRQKMREMITTLEAVPEIGSAIYDDPIADLINDLSDTIGTWACYYMDGETEGQGR